MDCLKPPPNFMEKTFMDGSQTLKSAKVFSLESFPLYDMFQGIAFQEVGIIFCILNNI